MSSDMRRTGIEVYSAQADILGEGPAWFARESVLFWLDIARKMLHSKGPSDVQRRSWHLLDYPGCLAELAQGSIAIAMGDGIKRLRLDSGTIDLLRAVPSRLPGTRFNDGKVDPCGRLWTGTMQNNFGSRGESVAVERSDGVLYRFDPDGRVYMIEEKIGIANTFAWSPDSKRFYFADSLRSEIYVYEFDAGSGAVRNKRTFFDAPHCGVPDGSAMDVDGCLWNARWDGAAVLRITPQGEVDRTIQLPALRATSCAFGGNNLDTLFVTSATMGLTADQLERYPLSGCVVAIHGIAQGMPVPPMACDWPAQASGLGASQIAEGDEQR